MCQHLDIIRNTLPDPNYDQPERRWNAVEDRVVAMADIKEMAGEIEICYLATCLKSAITVHTKSTKLLYGREYEENAHFNVLYTECNARAGHYDALVGKGQQSEHVQPSVYTITPGMLSHIPKLQPKKQTNRSTKPEVLTSSPYVNRLKEKEKLKRKPPAVRAMVKCRKRLCKTTKKAVVVEDWFCKVCTECRVEDMVTYTTCGVFIHEACAGGTSPNYKCDMD
jgi:hypothetical protein